MYFLSFVGGSKPDKKAKIQTKKTIEQVKGRNDEKEGSHSTKLILFFIAIVALIYSIMMIVFFSSHIEDADKAGEDYLCINDDISVYKPGASGVKNIAE